MMVALMFFYVLHDVHSPTHSQMLYVWNMYRIFTNICPKYHPNVGKYNIHETYGITMTITITTGHDYFKCCCLSFWNRPHEYPGQIRLLQTADKCQTGYMFSSRPMILQGPSLSDLQSPIKEPQEMCRPIEKYNYNCYRSWHQKVQKHANNLNSFQRIQSIRIAVIFAEECFNAPAFDQCQATDLRFALAFVLPIVLETWLRKSVGRSCWVWAWVD